jgi:uncharacterized protein (TIGR04255 family)
MFEDLKLPIKIEPSPIKKTVFEIRYNTKIPGDAVLGTLYPVIRKYFSAAPESLPILQLPVKIREADPNLRYQPYHKVAKGNLGMTIGAHSIVFTCEAPYCGWIPWKNFFLPILEEIFALDFFDFIERTGFRTINMFSQHFMEKTNTVLEVSGRSVVNQPTSLRTEFAEKNYKVVVNLADGIPVQSIQLNNNTTVKAFGAVLDIDCIRILDTDFSDFKKIYEEVIEESHLFGKKYFFGMLKKSFLETFHPVYNEGDR